jgi:hypothetical protein
MMAEVCEGGGWCREKVRASMSMRSLEVSAVSVAKTFMPRFLGLRPAAHVIR